MTPHAAGVTACDLGSRCPRAQPGTRGQFDHEQPSPPVGEKLACRQAQVRGRLFIPGGKATGILFTCQKLSSEGNRGKGPPREAGTISLRQGPTFSLTQVKRVDSSSSTGDWKQGFGKQAGLEETILFSPYKVTRLKPTLHKYKKKKKNQFMKPQLNDLVISPGGKKNPPLGGLGENLFRPSMHTSSALVPVASSRPRGVCYTQPPVPPPLLMPGESGPLTLPSHGDGAVPSTLQGGCTPLRCQASWQPSPTTYFRAFCLRVGRTELLSVSHGLRARLSQIRSFRRADARPASPDTTSCCC